MISDRPLKPSTTRLRSFRVISGSVRVEDAQGTLEFFPGLVEGPSCSCKVTSMALAEIPERFLWTLRQLFMSLGRLENIEAELVFIGYSVLKVLRILEEAQGEP